MEQSEISKERTYRFNLYNFSEKPINFFLEPDGMNFNIPPKVTYNIIWNEGDQYPVNFVFEQDKEGEFYYSLEAGTFAAIYVKDELICGIEELDLDKDSQKIHRLTESEIEKVLKSEVVEKQDEKITNRVKLGNNQEKSIFLMLEGDGMDFIIPAGSEFEVVWELDRNYANGVAFHTDKDGEFFYSLGTGTVFANVYLDGTLIYPVWGQDGLIVDWRSIVGFLE